MANTQRAYFGLDLIVSLILWFFLGWILGAIVAFQRGNMIWGILRILSVFVFLSWIFWILDLISFLMHKDLVWLV